MRKKLLSEKVGSKFLANDKTSMDSSSEPENDFLSDKNFRKTFHKLRRTFGREWEKQDYLRRRKTK